MDNVKLSAEDRQKLRTAVREHERWPRVAAGRGIADLTKTELLDVAEELSIDLDKLFGGPLPVHTPAVTEPPEVANTPDIRGAVEIEAADTAPIKALGNDPDIDLDIRTRETVDELVSRAMAMPVPEMRDELVRLYSVELTTPKTSPVVAAAAAPAEPAAVAMLSSTAVASNVVPLPAAGEPRIIDTLPVHEVFKLSKPILDGRGQVLTVGIWNDPNAPTLDPSYIWTVNAVRSVIIALNANQPIPVWLFGPPGTGKSAFVKNLCAVLKRNFVRVNFEASAERYELIGGERARNATMVWQDGALVAGLRRPGSVILLDEIAFAKPEHLASLHALLERGGRLTINETGEVVEKTAGVAFIAADNSNGTGDTTSMFAGLRDMNRALLSRFGVTIRFEYLQPEAEAHVLSQTTGLPKKAADLLVSYANKARAKTQSGDLEIAPSLRELSAWAELLLGGIEPREAFTQTVANKLTEASAELAQQEYRAHVPEGELIRAIKGTTVTADDPLAAPPGANGKASKPDASTKRPLF